jgi:tetratricopeptide (TPR) repeat protein
MAQRSTDTHRNRLAKIVRDETGISLMQAAQMVAAAAAAGRLPAELNTAERMHTAVFQILELEVGFDADQRPVQPYRRTYPGLSELLPGGLCPAARHAVRAARTAGMEPVGSTGAFTLGWIDPDRAKLMKTHLRRIRSAGPLQGYAFASIRAGRDGELLVDQALDALRTGCGIGTYRDLLVKAVAADPRDVDAYAHLGSLAVQLHDADGESFFSLTTPGKAERRDLLNEALGWYQSGVAVADLALDLPFTGVLSRGELNNRPFYRAIHGLALTLWRMGRFITAERVLLAMLRLDPCDELDAHGLLTDIRARRSWRPGLIEPGTPRELPAHLTHRPVHLVPGSLRQQLMPTPTGKLPPPSLLSGVIRAAAFRAFGGRAAGITSFGPTIRIPVDEGGMTHTVRIVARHQRGHDLTQDAYWWDCHHSGRGWDDTTLIVLVADTGQVLLAQLLRRSELADYRAAGLPRSDRTAFTTTFVHGDRRYGLDLTLMINNALDQRLDAEIL